MPARFKKQIIYILLFYCSFSCVEKFNPTLEQYENILVVDGFFTNEAKRHKIKLFNTTNVYSTEFIPISGADIKVVSEDGDIFIFNEWNIKGEYYSDNDAKGEPGKKYKLTVSFNNVMFYETDFQELKPSPPIDSIFSIRKTKQTWDIEETLDGLQFYLNTKNNNSVSDYFLWEATETFEYDAEMFIDSYYAGGFFKFPDEDSLFTCWKTNILSNIFTHTVKHSDKKGINNFPLQYVANNSKKLSKKYSLLVKQFSLSEGAYHFWNTIREQNANEGELYSKQPFQVRGNLKNIDNPEQVVLGYFTVAGVSQKRIFVDKPKGMTFPSMACIPDPESLGYISLTSPNKWPKYISMGELGLGVIDNICVDCRERGGDIIKPDFWR